ncbi:DUF6404 family protein [uncultured Sulfitobacter sp.]|uniref:DUF6404 family protein n=1 Tax=uncultured Sulfitobacter sp. TaxID=191468 RepID=UPI002638B27A|nr:DUF6404 family protein [uncultured Sulfitobacter sp.]
MSDRNLEARLSRLNAQAAAPKKARLEKPVKMDRHQKRRDRLARALRLLNEAGVRGNYAYPLPFRLLSKVGYILKPLHFHSWASLTIFAMAMFTVIFLGAVSIANAIGYMPAPLARVIEVGPAMFLGVNIGFSVTFAAIYKRKAERIGLPRWREL